MKTRMLVTTGICALLIALVWLTSGCATKHEVKEIEFGKLDVKGKTYDGTIGINEKKQVVIREERTVEFELQVQDGVNMHLRDKVESDLHMLKLCHRDLADPRLGGNGKAGRIPSVDKLQTVAEVREELGLDEETGDLKIVREQFLNEKLAAERKFEKKLRILKEQAAERLEECESRMAIARRAVGLPSKRISGDGYFLNDGKTYVQTHRNENDLDDAFEMKAINEAQARQNGVQAPSAQKTAAEPTTERQKIEAEVNAMFDEDKG